MLKKYGWDSNEEADRAEQIAFYVYALGYPMIGNELTK